MAKVTSFEDLLAWQRGKDLGVLVYTLTKQFPKDEQFGLISQMRRAAVSVTSNIAEGFGRVQPKDKEHFYVIALGSVSEILSQAVFAKELAYVNAAQLQQLREATTETRKLLLGLLKAHRS